MGFLGGLAGESVSGVDRGFGEGKRTLRESILRWRALLAFARVGVGGFGKFQPFVAAAEVEFLIRIDVGGFVSVEVFLVGCCSYVSS